MTSISLPTTTGIPLQRSGASYHRQCDRLGLHLTLKRPFSASLSSIDRAAWNEPQCDDSAVNRLHQSGMELFIVCADLGGQVHFSDGVFSLSTAQILGAPPKLQNLVRTKGSCWTTHKNRR